MAVMETMNSRAISDSISKKGKLNSPQIINLGTPLPIWKWSTAQAGKLLCSRKVGTIPTTQFIPRAQSDEQGVTTRVLWGRVLESTRVIFLFLLKCVKISF